MFNAFQKDLDKGMYMEKDEFDISNVDTKQIDRRKMQGFLKLGEAQEVTYFMEEFFKELGVNAMKSNMFRQYITMDVYFCVTDFLTELNIGRG